MDLDEHFVISWNKMFCTYLARELSLMAMMTNMIFLLRTISFLFCQSEKLVVWQQMNTRDKFKFKPLCGHERPFPQWNAQQLAGWRWNWFRWPWREIRFRLTCSAGSVGAIGWRGRWWWFWCWRQRDLLSWRMMYRRIWVSWWWDWYGFWWSGQSHQHQQCNSAHNRLHLGILSAPRLST